MAVAGCSVARGTARLTGSAVAATAKLTCKVAGEAAKATWKGTRTVVNMVRGKHVINLTKKGNSLLVDTTLNRRVMSRMILDTGCTDTQISSKVASRMGIPPAAGRKTSCTVADGRRVSCREVVIRELRVGGVRVNNVRAVILDTNSLEYDGLLGMSFLNNFIFRVDSEKGELILERRT